ncbi:hypothetical protein I6E29_00910 [Arcanobacterium haemolyticum]|nr:hypothetical protein [Arcanobacterium haemolyticum]
MSRRKSIFHVGDFVRLKNGIATNRHGDELKPELSLTKTRHGFVVDLFLDTVFVQGMEDGISDWVSFKDDAVELVSKRPKIPEQPIPVGALVRDASDGELGIVVQVCGPEAELWDVFFLEGGGLTSVFDRAGLAILDAETIPALLKNAGELA